MHLIIERVSKQYGATAALRDVTLDLRPGILGLVGPNGAGKSTLMKILATITRPSAGRVSWNGTDIARSPDSLRDGLGYLPQDFGVYPNLNAVEFLEYIAAMKGLRNARRRIAQLLDALNLTEARRRPLGGYSGGMKQRVGIAQALLNDPQVLILDEPTVGLDPEERVSLRHLLTELAGDRIVILSTHIVSDVEAVAGELAVLSGGGLLRRDAPERFLADLEGRVWEWLAPSAAVAELRRRYLISGTVRRSDGVMVRAVCAQPPTAEARPVPPLLEDAYLAMVSGRAGAASP